MAAVVGLSSAVNERPFPLNPPPDSGNGIPDASLHSAFSRCCILTPSGHWTPLPGHEMQAGELGRGFCKTRLLSDRSTGVEGGGGIVADAFSCS